MIYPANFELKSGFASIRNTLHDLCLIKHSQNLVNAISFSSDIEIISRLLTQTAEMKNVLQYVPGFPQQDYYDLSTELSRIRTRGTYLDTETLSELKLSLDAITNIIGFIESLDDTQFGELKRLLPYSKPDLSINKRIISILDEKGDIRDSASEKLQSIRKDIKSFTSSIARRINTILSQARKDNLVNDDTELTVRNGRLVIPVPSGNKRKIRGYVHDASATGQTVYIEPAEVFEINNDIQNLKIEEKQEIINILISFSDFLRPEIDNLIQFYIFLGQIDFIRVKALLAIDMSASHHQLVSKPQMKWRNAVHPLLNKTLIKQGKEIVPQDISLDEEQRIMVISGPNAGGKSVTLKTVGLLQYMLQCGLLIPVNEDSESGVFDKIFLEIGDEQSLENDLSTYSSHLLHIKYFLENANASTLFLIDEFGAGTEPQLGGAMAEAGLEMLNELGSFGVVTTHYTNLKLLADKANGVFNAAMLYDTKAMKPLFKLNIGKPGSSFAFEIANKIGFPEKVVRNAASKVGSSQLDFEKQLAQLEVDKKMIAQKTAELKNADELLAELVDKYQKLLKDLENRKHSVLKEAKTRAQQIISESNKIIERTIREIKEHQAEKEATKQIREDLNREIESILLPEEDTDFEDARLINKTRNPERTITTGTYVKMEDQENVGIIEELKGNRALVTFGTLKIRTTLDKLILASDAEIRFYESSKQFLGRGTSSVINELNTRMAEFKMSIDIRGKKPEIAQDDLIRYIDQAILLRVSSVKILHGKGTGALRNMVYEILNENPEVIRLEDEKPDKGGHGITIVYLR